MNLSDKKYDAFISYRHGGIDQYIAENLHKKLEAFRLPKNILKSRGENEKTRITRVFRDRDELPLASDLADPITNAIRNSEFLIVICTKRLSESKWCMKEIETFIEFHGRDKIFAVLAEGEPQDSFPDILRFSKKIVVDTNGVEKEIEVEVEPLAADVRGKDNAERNKKLKEEVLRLAAPMFQLGYDDLRQRHREQVLKRRIMLASSIAVVGVTFATISTTLAFTIQKQSVKISQQSEKIQKQFTEALIENNKNLAENALIDLREGNVEQAIKTAVSALPKDEEDTQMPYVPQAEYALSQALRVYENGYRQMPAYLIDHESDVVDMELSPSGEKLLSTDRYGNCLVWNPQNKKEEFRINLETSGILFYEDMVHFVGDDAILYPTEKGLAVYDLLKQEVRAEKEIDSIYNCFVSKDQSLIVMSDMTKITLLDANTLEGKGTYEFLEAGITITKSEVSTDLGVLAIAYRVDGETPREYVKILNLVGLSEKYNCTPFYESVQNIYVRNNSLYVVANQNFSMEDALYSNLNGSIDCYDIQSGQSKWVYESDNIMLTELCFQENATNDLFLALSYDSLKSIHQETGIEDYEFRYGSKIIKVGTYKEGNFYLFTSQGEYHGITIDKRMDFSFPERFISHSINLNGLLVGKNFIATGEFQNPNICIYQQALGSKVEEVIDNEEVFSQVVLNSSEDKLLISSPNLDKYDMYLWDVDGSKLIKVNQLFDIPQKMIYMERDSEFWIYGLEGVYRVDPQNGDFEQIHTYNTQWTFEGVNEDGNIGFFGEKDDLIVFDFIKDEIVKKVVLFDKIDSMDAYTISDDLNKYIVANRLTNRMELYDMANNELLISKEEKLARIKYFYIDEKASVVFVCMKDGVVEVLDLLTLESIKTNDGLLTDIDRVQKIDGSGYIISGAGMAYFLDENFDIVARVNNYETYIQSSNTIYMNDGLSLLLKVPKYELDDYLQEAMQGSK